MAQNFSIKRSEFIPNMELTVNGYSFIYTGVFDRKEGEGLRVAGVLTCPDGSKKSFIEKGVLVAQLNKMAGATVARSDNAKKESSQSSGASKVVKITNLSEEIIKEQLQKRRSAINKAYQKLASLLDGVSFTEQYIVDTNNTLAELHVTLTDKLNKQREQLAVAKKAEAIKSISSRIQLLRSYIDNYNKTVGDLMVSGDITKAQIMVLNREDNIAKAQAIIARYAE